ncbi:MAG TPA: thioredoxin family protein [Stellaceae bacterium]|nr:thioredoxin family protein [Stellaceae bacterium]
MQHQIVSHEEWLKARLRLLAKEKEFTRLRDELSAARRDLPWERVDKAYVFDGPNGGETLAQLFDGSSQLVVYHFMFAPDWSEGCPSCSWWADNFERNVAHLVHRDVTLIAISRAPLAKLDAFKKQKGWTFKWVSSGGNDFNYDFAVSFRPEALSSGPADYNYRPFKTAMTELPGISVFYRDPDGAIYHTYSCYGRGVDMLNAGYHYLDLVPKGRDEDRLPYNQAWVRERDKYSSKMDV